MSTIQKGEKPIFLARFQKGEYNSMFKKPRVEGSEKPSQQIKVFDLKTNTTYYNSKCEASRALNINHLVINIYFLVIKLSLIKGRFVF